MRLAARKAVLSLQDDRLLRRALLARPRSDRSFASGDVVAYWRDQKWSQGVLSQGGKWYGSGVVIGLIGRNVIIAHRNHIIRCAPEQVRMATSEEKTLIETPGTELLGIKDMIESGTFRSSQYVDLLAQSYPPQEESVVQGLSNGHESEQRSAAMSDRQPMVSVTAEVPTTGETGQPDTSKVSPTVFDDDVPPQNNDSVPSGSAAQNSPVDTSASETPAESSSSYGPIRRLRVPSKSGSMTLHRPVAMRHDDFVEVMREVVPHLIENAVNQPDQNMAEDKKRPAEQSPEEPESKLAKHDSPVPLVEHAVSYVASAECSSQESQDLWNAFKCTQALLKFLSNSISTSGHRRRFLQVAMSLCYRPELIRQRCRNGKP